MLLKFAVSMDHAEAHEAEKVKDWCKKNRVILAFMPASLTFRYQCVDVALAAQMKGVLYELWADWMGKTVMNNSFRTKSWNYIAPSKADVVDWCMKS